MKTTIKKIKGDRLFWFAKVSNEDEVGGKNSEWYLEDHEWFERKNEAERWLFDACERLKKSNSIMREMGF